MYLSLAKKFEKLEKIKDAALCYFNGEDYSKARILFESSGNLREAAHMNYLLGHYKRAGKLYLEMNDYYSCLVCREFSKDLEGCTEILIKLFDELDDGDSWVNKNTRKQYMALFQRYAKNYFISINQQLAEKI